LESLLSADGSPSLEKNSQAIEDGKASHFGPPP